ncbi:MAG: hypothetical protein K2N63_05155 [Lachnospiraceae bacterium]|nr:hypothetical protein [Lachnospiraceae bacterium]
MKIEITEKMRKEAEKGKSVLKVGRTRAGGAKGAIAAALTLLIFGFLAGLPFLISKSLGWILIFGIFGIPALLFLVPGIILQAKKARNYLEYYEKESGYDVFTLSQAEKELMEPQTVAIGSRKKEVACYITENFLVSVTREGCYVRKHSDMVAAFYSAQIPGEDSRQEGMLFISAQDIAREPRTNPFTYRQCGGYVNPLLNQQCCREVAEELTKHIPHIITNQIFIDGKREYDLLSLDHWQEDFRAIRQGIRE